MVLKERLYQQLLVVVSLVMFLMSVLLNNSFRECNDKLSKNVVNAGQLLQVMFNTVLVILIMNYTQKSELSKMIYVILVVLSIVCLVCCSIILSDSTVKSCGNNVKTWAGTMLAFSILMGGGSGFIIYKTKFNPLTYLTSGSSSTESVVTENSSVVQTV